MNPPVQGEGFDVVLPHATGLWLDARSDVSKEDAILTFNRPHLENMPYEVSQDELTLALLSHIASDHKGGPLLSNIKS